MLIVYYSFESVFQMFILYPNQTLHASVRFGSFIKQVYSNIKIIQLEARQKAIFKFSNLAPEQSRRANLQIFQIATLKTILISQRLLYHFT